MQEITKTLLHRHAHMKDVDTVRREVTAVLTTEAPDLVGDIVLADGVQFRAPLPMFRNHDAAALAGT